MKTSKDLAWAAGVFEGEGSISGLGKNRLRPRLAMNMTDEDVMRRFHEIVGVGYINGPFVPRGLRVDGSPRKQQWRWTADKFEWVQAVLTAFWPWLGDRRRARTVEMLRTAKTRLPEYGWQTHCAKGHPFDIANTRMTPRRRVCRTCCRDIDRRYRAGKVA